ncbi:MAG: CHAD domain-containing protein [Candidatus Latescibacteria bacterium]|nr:CHAD domain-containing protein [Candidatus Latescibacterota bacterium]
MFFREMKAYYDNKLDETRSNFSLALEARDFDGIHNLRVGLKRMKAFFNMVEALDLDFDAVKRFRPFRRIAKKTGRLRDAQVQRKLVGQVSGELCSDMPDYLDYLERRELEAYGTFRTFAEKDPLSGLKKSRKHIVRALKPIAEISAETRALGRFHNQKNNLIILNSEPGLRDNTLHRVRKLSKEIHYTFELLQQCFHIYEDRIDFTAAIKTVHQVLGAWHDCDVSLGYIDAFKKTVKISSGDARYGDLKRRIHAEKNALHRQFRAVLDEFNETASAF